MCVGSIKQPVIRKRWRVGGCARCITKCVKARTLVRIQGKGRLQQKKDVCVFVCGPPESHQTSMGVEDTKGEHGRARREMESSTARIKRCACVCYLSGPERSWMLGGLGWRDRRWLVGWWKEWEGPWKWETHYLQTDREWDNTYTNAIIYLMQWHFNTDVAGFYSKVTTAHKTRHMLCCGWVLIELHGFSASAFCTIIIGRKQRRRLI